MSDESLSSVLLFSCFMNFMNFSLFESLFETNFNLFVVRRALRGFIIPWQQMELQTALVRADIWREAVRRYGKYLDEFKSLKTNKTLKYLGKRIRIRPSSLLN